MSRRTIKRVISTKAASLLLCAMLSVGATKAQTADEEQPDSATVEQLSTDSVRTNSEPAVSIPDTIETPVLRTISDSEVHVAHADPKYAYANDPAYWREIKTARQVDWLGEFFTKYGRTLRYTFYFLFISAMIIVIVRSWQENGFSFFTFTRGKRSVQEQLEGTIALDLDEEISLALQNQDWAAAVRFMYLKMLSMAQEKFPDAPQSIFTGHTKSGAFRYLRRAYEYIFYGGFPLSAAQFEQLQPRFTEAYQILST